MLKIVFLDAATLGDCSLEEIAAKGELTCYPTSSYEEALERVSHADVIITNKVRITDELMGKATNLKLICEAATGVNNIDLKAAERRGIPVRNVAGYSTEAVAQLAFTQILSLVCDVAYFDSVVKSGSYSESGLFTDVTRPYTELSGKTIGIIGMGSIGQNTARIASAFGMKVIYYSTSGTSHCSEYPSVSLEELLRTSDVVSIHCPLNEKTAGLIGRKELEMMNSYAIIVNMARGGIIDEAALADAISEGRIAGAALDVFEREPLPSDNPLLSCRHPERLRLTPHTAWASKEALKRLVSGVANNIYL